MLVLSRKEGETIVIDKTISVMVVEIRQDSVRLGIDAPVNIEVHREEVQQRIDEGEPSRRAQVESSTAATARETIPATADPDDRYVAETDATAQEEDRLPDGPATERARLLQAIADCQATIKIGMNAIRDANGEMQLLFADLGSHP